MLRIISELRRAAEVFKLENFPSYIFLLCPKTESYLDTFALQKGQDLTSFFSYLHFHPQLWKEVQQHSFRGPKPTMVYIDLQGTTTSCNRFISAKKYLGDPHRWISFKHIVTLILAIHQWKNFHTIPTTLIMPMYLNNTF